MGTSVEGIGRRLRQFYDFTGKTVLAVGAGGFTEYARQASSVLAIEEDPAAAGRLIKLVRQQGLADRFTILRADFLSVHAGADVVLFDFCLHEMPPHHRVVDHARQLAPDVIVIDHAPRSQWSWFAAEERLVEECWTAIPPALIRDQRDIEAYQRFSTFADLEARMLRQGPVSFARIAMLRRHAPIAIPMPYRLALLAGGTTDSHAWTSQRRTLEPPLTPRAICAP